MFAWNIFLLNSANIALLLSTISDIYAKMGNQDAAGPKITQDHFDIYCSEKACSIFHRFLVNIAEYPRWGKRIKNVNYLQSF